MEQTQIRNYQDFTAALLQAGFSMGGGNDEGIFALIPWNWEETPPYETPVRWHTGDADTDPWEWRMRVLDERTDVAYGKVFFKKSGFITRDWAPHFLAARRGKAEFNGAYVDGTLSHAAKRIYNTVLEYGTLPLRVPFPAVGPLVYLSENLTPEGNLPAVELRYERSSK